MSKQQKRQKHKNQKMNGNVGDTNVKIRPIISSQKRMDLNIILKKLYELTTTPSNNPKEEWQHYVEIQKLLHRIMELENVLSPRLLLAEDAEKQGTTTGALRVANIESFNKWLAQNSVKFDGFSLAEFPGYGLGVKAERDIQEGDILFKIPRKLMLNEEWLESQKEPNSMVGLTLSNVKLAYTLITETLRGEDSFWKPYIDLLPVEYNTPLYFSIEDMEELRGSNALSIALSHCKVIARQYATLYHCSQNAPRPDIINKTGQLFKEKFCYDIYRWAVSTATTRQNVIPKKGVKEPREPRHFISSLIPFWDMVNHKQGKITTFYEPKNEAIVSSAQASFKRGEQIFMHYGNRPNSELMIHNGFVNPENTHDFINIKMGLSSSDPLYTQRSNVLHWLEIPINGCELAVMPAPIFISEKLLAFVRIFNMNEAQLEHWNSPDHAKDLLYADCALETELESKTWKYLQTRLMLLLRVFPTTLEVDEAKLAEHRQGTIELSPIKALILEYRILEKRILAGALEYVTQRLKA